MYSVDIDVIVYVSSIVYCICLREFVVGAAWKISGCFIYSRELEMRNL